MSGQLVVFWSVTMSGTYSLLLSTPRGSLGGSVVIEVAPSSPVLVESVLVHPVVPAGVSSPIHVAVYDRYNTVTRSTRRHRTTDTPHNTFIATLHQSILPSFGTGLAIAVL